MRPSPTDKVRKMYEDTADSYANMMDAEIRQPVYAEVLGRLQGRIANTPGVVVNTACGSGHMLSMYHERYDKDHALLGVDLSLRMVSIAEEILRANARVVGGDMRDLTFAESSSSSAALNFFALHHL